MANQNGRNEPHYIYIGSDHRRVDWLCNNEGIAPLHCRIFWYSEGNSYYLEDLNSRSGTFLQNKRLQSGKPVPVSFGESFQIGQSGIVLLNDYLVQKLTQPGSFAGPLHLELQPLSPPSPPQPEIKQRDSTQTITREEMDALIALQAASNQSDQNVKVPPPSINAISISIGFSDNNDIVIPNGIVSGQHARIYEDNEKFILEDQSSLNGTWFRGKKISRVFIQPEDVFMLGSYRLVLDHNILEKLTKLKRKTSERISRHGKFEQQVVKIGRDPSNDIVLETQVASGFHCTLTMLASGNGFQVRDENSTNGTHLNSRENRIDVAVAGLNDVLFFGSYRFPISKVTRFLKGETEEKKLSLPQKATFVIGRDSSADVQIDQPQVSRRHAEVKNLQDGTFEIRDLGSSNGTFVANKLANKWTKVNPGDSVSLGSYQIRLDPEKGVVQKDYYGDIMIQAERVSIDVPDRNGKGTKRILNDCSFTAYPTEFVGLMGPSGAGKTTLMMALNGYTPPSTGRSLINGVDLYENYNAFRGNIGYVPQDDIVFPQLTVYESLYYTARLRLPSDTTREEIDRKIDEILTQLEIQQTRDVLIGDAVKKGISGGQRKRVNLAQELITSPALLFLDEPTSGLASEDTLNVMKLLKGLTDNGKTILLTIHQPSVEVYRMMTNIIYLFQGNMVYYGGAYPDSITFFNPDVKEGPELEKLLADPGNAMKPLAEDQRNAFSAPKDQIDQRINRIIEKRTRDYQVSRYYKEFVYDRAGGDQTEVKLSQGNKQKTDRKDAFRQWTILSSRAARIKWKDRMNTFILMIQAPIIAAILALVYFGKVGGPDQYFDTMLRGPSALFLLVAAAVWFGASNSAREIVSEIGIYRRERMVNLMIHSYVFSKFAVLGGIAALQCLLMLSIIYFPLHLEGSFLAMYITLLLASLTGVGMGLTLSALTKSGEAAVALVPLILIPQIILGGVIMPIHEMNTPMKVLSTLMASRWGYESMLYIEYGDDDVDAMQEKCDISDCSWGVVGITPSYYPSDPSAEPVSHGGLQTASQPAYDADVNDANICTAFCTSLQNGQEITPLDRSFGVDDEHPTRTKARDEVNNYKTPLHNSRTSPFSDYGILFFFNIALLGLVIAILKFKDVEVE